MWADLGGCQGLALLSNHYLMVMFFFGYENIFLEDRNGN